MAKKSPPVKLTNRDFSSIKQDLTEYAKAYYPDTFKDFNEASFGALMLDLVAYVGDMLSFYVDYQANESFMDSAIETKNIVKLAKQLGYKHPGAHSSSGKCAFYVTVDATNGAPSSNDVPILNKGSVFSGRSGAVFTLAEDVDFSNPKTDIVVAEVNSDGLATKFAYKAYGTVISGRVESELVTIGEYERFMRIPLSTENITEVVSIVDSEGHEYFQVENLSQNIIYKEVRNTLDSTSEHAPYILQEISVPRRFTVEHTIDGETFIQFGYGSEKNLKQDKLPEPTDVVLNLHGKNYYSDDSFDPSILLTTDKFGVVPPSGQMTITVRSNSAENVNAGINSVTSVISANLTFKNPNLTPDSRASITTSVEVDNEEVITGQIRAVTPEEIRTRAIGAYASQNRAVTRQDYMSLVYRMPSNFGAVKRANIVQDKKSIKRNLNLYVVSEDSSGNLLETSSTVKSNLRSWLNKYKMINDTIDILPGRIANIGVQFEVIGMPDKNSNEVLTICLNALKDEYSNHFYFGEPFYISDVYRILNDLEEVVDTKMVKVISQYGTNYSGIEYEAEANITSDGRFVKVPEDVVLEIKYPDIDIIGVVV
tara:strand:- start:9350 stop:11137 length:1788 start_codon:yes stop_codon:yes gene_type:complete